MSGHLRSTLPRTAAPRLMPRSAGSKGMFSELPGGLARAAPVQIPARSWRTEPRTSAYIRKNILPFRRRIGRHQHRDLRRRPGNGPEAPRAALDASRRPTISPAPAQHGGCRQWRRECSTRRSGGCRVTARYTVTYTAEMPAQTMSMRAAWHPLGVRQGGSENRAEVEAPCARLSRPVCPS